MLLLDDRQLPTAGRAEGSVEGMCADRKSPQKLAMCCVLDTIAIHMQAKDISTELDREPFKPAYLTLTDGSHVEIPVPYLSFIHKQALFAARGIRRKVLGSSDSEVQLIPVSEIAVVRRSIPEG